MHAGTTTDTFLRQNLEWMGKAMNWAKFGAIAALGVINKGHLKEAKTLMSPYLPQVPSLLLYLNSMYIHVYDFQLCT